MQDGLDGGCWFVDLTILSRQLHHKSKPGSSRRSSNCPLPPTGLAAPSKPKGSRRGSPRPHLEHLFTPKAGRRR